MFVQCPAKQDPTSDWDLWMQRSYKHFLTLFQEHVCIFCHLGELCSDFTFFLLFSNNNNLKKVASRWTLKWLYSQGDAWMVVHNSSCMSVATPHQKQFSYKGCAQSSSLDLSAQWFSTNVTLQNWAKRIQMCRGATETTGASLVVLLFRHPCLQVCGSIWMLLCLNVHRCHH